MQIGHFIFGDIHLYVYCMQTLVSMTKMVLSVVRIILVPYQNPHFAQNCRYDLLAPSPRYTRQLFSRLCLCNKDTTSGKQACQLRNWRFTYMYRWTCGYIMKDHDDKAWCGKHPCTIILCKVCTEVVWIWEEERSELCEKIHPGDGTSGKATKRKTKIEMAWLCIHRYEGHLSYRRRCQCGRITEI